jgi:hypothetical protein
MRRYYIGFLITFLLLLLLVILFIHPSNKPNVPSIHMPLADYATTGSYARLTIDGPTNADIEHQQVQITVNASNVTFAQLQGYNGKVVVQEQFANSLNAYSAFLKSLALGGYTQGNTSSALRSEQGYCPLGDRYIFELNQGGSDIERLWATSCPGITKTYDGNLPLTLDLFEAQVPNYINLVRNVTF